MLCLLDRKIERFPCGYLNDKYVSSQIQKTTPGYFPVFNESNVSNIRLGDQDVLYQTALKLLEDHSELPISKIQRQLKIDYNKAASIEDRLIKDGMLGDPIGENRGSVVLIETWISIQRLLRNI